MALPRLAAENRAASAGPRRNPSLHDPESMPAPLPTAAVHALPRRENVRPNPAWARLDPQREHKISPTQDQLH